MLSTTCKGARRQSDGRGFDALLGEERLGLFGVQECPDGSIYEGGFVNGLKHGKGKFSWRKGEVMLKIQVNCTQKGYARGKMLSMTCKGVTVAAEPELVTGKQSDGQGSEALLGEERQGLGVQECPDRSRYEGEFVNGLKHGKGRLSWRNGEYYEGSFYKDYRHGEGTYCWPTGHKFIGKFYLNRKEGYGQHVFPDGATFQGLYHTDQRFGPGVLSYQDGRQDVGLWLGEHLIKLCTSVDEGFSLKDFPEYATYLDLSVTTDSLTEPQFFSTGLQTSARTHSKVDIDRNMLSDEFIYPPGMESYSTDGDNLPLPPGRRRELDQSFYGELWEPDAHPYQGYERDPLSSLPLQARMQANIHQHRRQAENVGWDVAAVLSLNREGFGPKGPLEVTSELWIQHSFRGELQALSQILQTDSVHPDVADSSGHTALIAATVNCHNDVIHLLLDMGVDIDKLNCEGMSALAVCHVLYYPFHCLHTTLIEPPAKNSMLKSPVDFNGDTPTLNNRPQAIDTTSRSHTRESHLSDQTSEESTQHISHHSSEELNDRDLISEHCLDLNEPEIPTDNEHLQEERTDKEAVDKHCEETEREEEDKWRRQDEESKGEGRDSQSDQIGENGENEVNVLEREFKKEEKKQEYFESRESRETESRYESIKEKDDVEVVEDIEEREERESEDVPGVEHSVVEDIEEKEERGSDVPGVEHSVVEDIEKREKRGSDDVPGVEHSVVKEREERGSEDVPGVEHFVVEERVERGGEDVPGVEHSILEDIEEKGERGSEDVPSVEHSVVQDIEEREERGSADVLGVEYSVVEHIEEKEEMESEDVPGVEYSVVEDIEEKEERGSEDAPGVEYSVVENIEEKEERGSEDVPGVEYSVVEDIEEKEERGSEDAPGVEYSVVEDIEEKEEMESEDVPGVEYSVVEDIAEKEERGSEDAPGVEYSVVENIEEKEERGSEDVPGVEYSVVEDIEEKEERESEDVPGVERSVQVLDGHISLGSVQWKEARAKQGEDKDFDSDCSVSSYNIQITEEVLQRSAEALSHIGNIQQCESQGTVRKMAAMKIEHRIRLKTLKLLLERGANPNIARVPMPVLFLAIMAADTEAVKRLLLCGARAGVPLPPKKSLYPLHVAAALPGPAGPRITELLLHTAIDPDTQACDQTEIYEQDKTRVKTEQSLSISESPHLKEGGRTALHIACQRDSDHKNASEVVALLLAHGASTDLLWSGHSPLSLTIASGNEMAVEALLNGGADPNMPLGRHVGNALCALANINYRSDGNRLKLLDRLVKAGADMLMPVMVGDVMGTAADFALNSFKQDPHIANTPFHVLNKRDRETFTVRRQLLNMMETQMKQTAAQRERGPLERKGLTLAHSRNTERFVYSGARSMSSNRTNPLSTEGIRKSVGFKTPRGSRPMLKFKTVPRPLSVKLESQSVPNPLSDAEVVMEDEDDLMDSYSYTDNYSFN